MATWPTTLPQAGLHSTWAENDGDIVIKSEMDAGKPKRRQRFTAAYPIFPMGMALTYAQWVALKTFYVANAAIPFVWVDPLTRAAANVMFDSRPQVESRRGALYMVKFSIEVQL
jgi:hypothetical protein